MTAIDVDKRTGDVWLGLFGGGLARLSGGRFDHWHQLNGGLVNDVVYGVTIEHDHVWAATTAGASRYNTVTGEWTVFTEKNAPMEEIWNYAVNYAGGDKVYLAVWGSGVLEYDIKTGRWKEFLDPDGEMEIDLYRDDGINHVIVTGANEFDGVVWVSSYFGASRYDGRHWRGYAEQEGGLPSDFNNNIRARSKAGGALLLGQGPRHHHQRARGGGRLGGLHARSGHRPRPGEGDAGGRVVEEIDMPLGVPHSFMIAAEVDGDDIWIGTGKGLGWGIGEGLPGTEERPLYAYGVPVEPGARLGSAPVIPRDSGGKGPEESAVRRTPRRPARSKLPGVTRRRPRRRQGGKPWRRPAFRSSRMPR